VRCEFERFKFVRSPSNYAVYATVDKLDSANAPDPISAEGFRTTLRSFLDGNTSANSAMAAAVSVTAAESHTASGFVDVNGKQARLRTLADAAPDLQEGRASA
jgi:hypothetical protein